MRVNYDTEHDILYLTLSDQRTVARYVEKETGDIFRVDPATGALLGVTVQFFLHRLNAGETIDLPEVHVGGILPTFPQPGLAEAV